ncbi:unnamed protein product [Ilex paraguariensis]|uniref:Uncharacterized protein n=1 Tax=Ilex paraguariensis TaxID=185542 RepID=A0ABC8RT60_9AQUA
MMLHDVLDYPFIQLKLIASVLLDLLSIKMSSSNTMAVSLLILSILSAHMISSTAASYRGLGIMEKRINSRQVLSELVLNFSKMKQSNRREMKSTDRETPEGPDPQHH